jgi:GWxTD domain-containing protein
VLALLAFASLAGAKDAVIVEPPLQSEGDLLFELDWSGFRGADDRTEEEIFLDLPNDQIAFRDEEGVLRGKLKLEIEISQRGGKRIFESSETLMPEASSELETKDRSIHQVIRRSALLPPGEYVLGVTLTDEKSEKPGLIHLIRKTKKKGKVEELIRIPDLGREDLLISDVLFSSDVRLGTGEGVGRNGVLIRANPGRKYGMVIPFLSYYAEVYTGAEFQPQDSLIVRTRVLDSAGKMMLEKQALARPTSDAFVAHDEVELSHSLRAGTYALEIAAYNPRTGSSASSQRDFEVIWAIASWSKNADTLLEEMKLILRADEYEKLKKLSPGAREIYIAEFWHGLDPDPATPQNETLLEFQRRVLYADREFSGTLGRGLLSDRGRVYVRYGPPDEVSSQYSSSAFGEDENVERVTDPAERVSLSNRPPVSFLDSDEFREGDVSGLSTQRGGTNIKAKEIEVWSYDGKGRALNSGVTGTNTHRGLKFIFADEMGNGEFQLIGSEGTTDF